MEPEVGVNVARMLPHLVGMIWLTTTTYLNMALTGTEHIIGATLIIALTSG